MSEIKLILTNSFLENNIQIKGLSDIANYIKKDADVVVYLDNEVLIGKYENSKLIFINDKDIDIKYLKRMRIFNSNEELYIWKTKQELKARYRNDEEKNGTKIEFIEADQVIFGTKSKNENNYTYLTEERNTNIILPGKWEANNKRKRVAIKTRHYIEYFDGYQASFFDSRFVEFVQLPIEGGK